MKKLFLALAALALACPAFAQAQSDAPDVGLLAGGEMQTLALSTVSEITLPQEGGISIQLADGTEINVAPDAFQALLFNFQGEMGIQAATQTPALRLVSGSVISFTDGILLLGADGHKAAYASGRTLSLAGVPSGVYFAVSGGVTLKLLVP